MSWRARLSTVMVELRFHPSLKPEGKGLRSFFENNYAELKQLNPGMGMPYRPHTGDASPSFMNASYGWGESRRVETDGMTEQQVEEKVIELMKIGETLDKAPNLIPHDRDIINELDVRMKRLR
ncbi:hypothetical protein QOT17_014615 [Balamuthia mandrillaris]